jgi:5'-3' exoribonuclease 2
MKRAVGYLVLIAFFPRIDGVAPRAKMNQQRARRFRSAQEAKEADEKKQEFQKMLAKQNANKGDYALEEEVIKKTWDSNVITPGTPFMDILAAALRYWIAYKLNTDPAWEKVCLPYSSNTRAALTFSAQNYHFRCYCTGRRRA